MSIPSEPNLQLAHERLDVYQISIKFLALSADAIERFPPGYSSLADQLRRASVSIPLNIAEGNGKTGIADRKRFFSIARGSANECGAILDALIVLKISTPLAHREGKELLVRIVMMLTRMIR